MTTARATRDGPLPEPRPPTARPFSLRRRTGRWRDALRRRYLAAADVMAVLVAGAVSGISPPRLLLALVALPVWIVLAKLHGLYDRDHRVMRHLTSDELGSLIAWAATGSLAVLGLAGLIPGEPLAAADGVRLVLALAIVAPVTRALARWLWRCSVSPEQVLVVGSGRLAHSTRRKLEIFGDMHQILVPVTVEPTEVADPASARKTLDHVLAAHPLDRVVVAAETLEEPVVVALVIACRERLLKLGFVPPAPAAFASTARLGRLAELPVVDSLTCASHEGSQNPIGARPCPARQARTSARLVPCMLTYGAGATPRVRTLLSAATAVGCRRPVVDYALGSGGVGRAATLDPYLPSHPHGAKQGRSRPAPRGPPARCRDACRRLRAAGGAVSEPEETALEDGRARADS